MEHISLHFCLSAAALASTSQVFRHISFSSLSAILLQVYLGLPFFLFPSGIYCKAILLLSFLSPRSMCPIYLHLFSFMLSSIDLTYVFFLSSLLFIFIGQKIFIICLRHLFWNVSHFCMSFFVILQHSDRGHGGRVVTLSPPTSAAGVRSPSWP